MKGNCILCKNEYDSEEFIQGDIRELMEKFNLCFTCAFWKWQWLMDKKRSGQDILPLVTQEYYKDTAKVNRKSHWCLTLGLGTLPQCNQSNVELFRNVSRAVITLDGYIFPVNNGRLSLTHQGDIPVNNQDFKVNAKFLNQEEYTKIILNPNLTREPLEPLVSDSLNLLFRNPLEYIKVPEEIVKEVFNV